MVIPQAFLDLVLAEGAEQERMEAWIVDEVKAGRISEGEIDRALTRLFVARVRLGMFDPKEQVPF